MIRRSALMCTGACLALSHPYAAIAQGTPTTLPNEPAAPASATSVAEPANAADRGASSGGIEDIVVTARRLEENLQTTPVAVTAITAEALQEAQVATVQDLQRTAPSLVIASGTASFSGMAFVSIRGQGNLTPLVANDPAVAIYMDGVYIPRPAQGLTDMHDMLRVEVLRGPQGTLFGRNTTGGALNLLSKDPVNVFEGAFKAEIGNIDHKEVGVILNAPLTDNLSARVVYNFRDRGGYGRNATLDRDVADQRSHFARGKLKYESDGFDLTLSGDYNRITDKAQIATMSAYNANLPLAAGGGFIVGNQAVLDASLHRRENWHTTYAGGLAIPTANPLFATLTPEAQRMYRKLPFDVLTAYGFGAVANVEIGAATLKSITGYRYMNTDALLDTDGTPVPLLATFGGTRSRQFSQELQLSGDITESLSYITGAYFSRETGHEYSRSQIFGGLLRNSFGTAKNISKGLYAQLYYELTDTLRATGGFRYTWDTRNTTLNNRQVLGLAPDAIVATSPSGFNCNNAEVVAASLADRPALAAICAQHQNAKFDYPAWTGGLDWQAADGLFLYVKSSGAAKAGGWNMRAGSLPSFSPEKVRDVEGGIKADLFDRRLRTNVALFHTWKKDAQAVANAVVPGIGVTQFIQNNGDARIWGAEFEIVAVPWDGMEINGNLSLQDAKYVAGTYTETQRIASATPLVGCAAAPPTAGGVPQFDCIADYSGTELPQLPKTQLSIGATQKVPVGENELSLHLDYAYISSQRYNSAIPAPQQSDIVKAQYAAENRLNKISGYGLFNGRISFELSAPGVEIYAFGRNLANNKYVSKRFSDLYRQIGFAMEFPGVPRTWGVGLSWKFGDK